jgi:hypothetical protein
VILLPYGGTTPEEDAKIEKCVNAMLSEGRTTDKTQAIRICKAQTLKERKAPIQTGPQ